MGIYKNKNRWPSFGIVGVSLEKRTVEVVEEKLVFLEGIDIEEIFG